MAKLENNACLYASKFWREKILKMCVYVHDIHLSFVIN